MPKSISYIEKAFREQSEKQFVQPDRQFLQVDGSSAIVRIMSAAIPKMDAIGVKALLGSPSNRKQNSTYFATMIFDPQDAALLAIISANRLTQLRTGAASAIATKYLAKKGAKRIGIVGAGIQGYGQLEGLASIVRVEQCRVFDIDLAKIQTMSNRAQENLGIEVRASLDIKELYDCDVLCTATPSVEPIIFSEALHPGLHINAIGSNAPNRREIHEEVLLRSKVFVDKLEQVLKEAGDVAIPIKRGAYSSSMIQGEICDVISGKLEGRATDSDVTLFKSVGIALEDIALARGLYDLAVRNGIGIDIDF